MARKKLAAKGQHSRPVRYFLRVNAISPYPELTIDKERFTRLKRARPILVSAFSMEELYEIVLGLYKALEKTAFDISVEQIAHGGMLDYEEFYSLRAPLNVGLISLLTAVRLYLDSLVLNARRCLPESTTVKADVIDRTPGFEPPAMWEKRTYHATLAANTAGGFRFSDRCGLMWL